MKKSKYFIKLEIDFKKLQKHIINELKSIDSKIKIHKTNWKYKTGGGGLSCEILGNNIIEKGMINFSSIKGTVLPESALAKKIKGGIKNFVAAGVSVVIHPNNPFVPCSHMNIRCFETNSSSKNSWWYGGGFDLTPYFVYKEDIMNWHRSAKRVCDRYNPKFYKEFSKNCDEYFYNKHRKEKRGIGGLFFDNLNQQNKDFYSAFLNDVGKTYIESYADIIKQRYRKKFTKTQKEFQYLRRARYVEFNLLYDRGTIFGLQSGGRPDSILMSMPPKVMWISKKNSILNKYEKDLKKFL